MEVEYFVSTDGQCPPRGQQRVPTAADGWLTSLMREAASLRQEIELKSAAAEAPKLSNATSLGRHLRLPTSSPVSSSLHNFRFSLGLPSRIALPTLTAPQMFHPPLEVDIESQDPLINRYFPLSPREVFDFTSGIHAVGEDVRWSLAEDRALLHLDASFQALTEGYLGLQHKFPRLFPKTTTEWAALRIINEKHKSELEDASGDAVELSDPEALRDRKVRSSIIDMLPRLPDLSAPDAVFKRRLQEIKADASRHKLLLCLPEDPSIFLPALQADEGKSYVPQPKQREPSAEERRETLREALFGGKVDSKEARALVEFAHLNAMIECSDGHVACNSHLLAAAAPFFGRQAEGQPRLEVKFNLSSHEEALGQGPHDIFSGKVVQTFVALCHQPNLLPRVSEMRKKRDEMQRAFETEYSEFVREVVARKDQTLESLACEKKMKEEATSRVFKDMLAEDINNLTRIYRQHVSKEIEEICGEIDLKVRRANSHFKEELGYLELAKAHFQPLELKSLDDQLGVIEEIIRKDFFSPSDLPLLLRLSEMVLASGVRTQILQAMSANSLPADVLRKAFSEGASRAAMQEFLAMLPDEKFLEIYEAERVGVDSSFTQLLFSELSVLHPIQDESLFRVCLRGEWASRMEAKRQEICGMSRDDISLALEKSKSGGSSDVYWKEMLTFAITARAGSQNEKLIALHEGGGRGVLTLVSRGVFDIQLCSAGLPLQASTVSPVRVGESARTVYFESSITSAFLSDVFPFTVQVGLEPIGGCLNHVQLSIAKENTHRTDEERRLTGTFKAEFREDQNARFFGSSHARPPRERKFGFPGVHAINVSSTEEKLFVHGCGWSCDGLLFANGVAHCVQEGFTVNDVVGVALNLLSGRVQYYKNGRSIHFTSLVTGREIALNLRAAVAFKPCVALQSTATRNAVYEEDAVEPIIASLLQTLPLGGRSSLSQQDVLSLRLHLSDPFSHKSNEIVGFAQFIEM